jgi:hypothetical protein
MSATPPAPLGPDWKPWGERLVSYMTRVRSQLVTYIAGDKATDDGVIAWDRTGYPVVSKGGVFRQIVLADGYGAFIRSTSQTAVAINTAYAVGWDAPTFNIGIALDAADSTKIVFDEDGVYFLAFAVELLSGSASAKNAWFWPRIDGTDVAGSTIKTTLSANSQYMVMSRSAVFSISAGSYLQAMWATDDTDLEINAPAATAFAPSSPSVTLAITRLRQ